MNKKLLISLLPLMAIFLFGTLFTGNAFGQTSPAFLLGNSTSINVCINSVNNDISGYLHVSDTDPGKTENWSQSSGPDHGGTLSFNSATASSGSTDIAPGGTITYTPANLYSGPESFTVQVSDGTNTTTITFNVSIQTSPATPSAISGTSPVCQSNSGVAYSVSADANINSYTWTYDGTNYTIHNGTTNSITMDFANNATSGNLQVTATNACATSSASTQAIVVQHTPATPSAISGTSPVCQSNSGIAYSVSADANINSYTWTYDGTNYTIHNGTTNSITMDFANNATSGNLQVTATNACATSSSSTQAIVVQHTPATPNAISGSISVCTSNTSAAYSISPDANIDYYTWTYDHGATPSGTSNSITVDYTGATTGTLQVVANNTCGFSPARTLGVTVNSAAPAQPSSYTASTSVICQGQSAITYAVSSSANTDYYIWHYSGSDVNINGAGNNNNYNGINTVTANFSSTATSGSFQVMAHNACGNSTSEDVAVVVSHSAALTSTPSPTPICDNSNFSYTATSDNPAATFAWTRDVSTYNTASSGNSANINETLHNGSANTTSVIYHVTVSVTGCADNLQDVTALIKPTPSLSSSLTPAAICDNATFHYTPTSATTGTTFSWTRASVTNITPAGPTAGSNDPAEALHNSSAAPINVTYVYTLAANGCTNPSTYSVTFAVNPTATLSSTLSPANICDNATFHYTPTSATTGTTFSWTRASVGYITPAGPTAGNDDPAEALHNSSAAPINVTYVYTLAANGCTNPTTYNVTFAVNPTATLSSTLSPANICDNATFHYTPTSATTGTSFSWTRASVTNITPAGPTAGNDDPAEALHNSTAAPINVTYVYTLAANGCTNPSTYNVTFAVNPTATLSSTLTPAAICDNATFHYTPTSATTGTTFSWTRSTVANITPAGPTAGSNDPAEALHNSSAAPINVTYVYTLAANGCTNPTTYNVTFAVNPTATLSSTLSPANICDNGTFHYTPTSLTTGTTFSWTRATVANITPAGPTAGNDDPAEALHNSSAAPINVTYVYTLAANGCTNPSTYSVTFAVNPTATLSSTLSPANICDNATFHYTPTSATTGTSFSWTRASVTNIAPAGPTVGSNDPAEALHNSSAAPINVTYVYTLAANGCTNPTTYNVTFAVNPTATLSSTLSPANICDNGTFHYTPTSATTGTTFSWTRATVANITPAGPTAGNDDPAEALHNSSAAPINVTYVYTLAANGCTNPSTYNVTFAVNPTATLSSTLTPAAICDNATFHYTPTSATTGTTFSWTRASVTNITPAGPTAGNDDPAEALHNSSAAPINVTYVYTLAANGCTNPTTYNVTLAVNPTATLSSTLSPANICDNATFHYTPTSATTGTTFSWTRATVANITPAGPTAGNDDPAEALHNSSAAPINVTYVYTLAANGCTNPSTYNVTFNVNPTATLSSTLNPANICDNATFHYTPTSATTGTSFSWTRASVTNITPVGPTAGSNDPAEALHNSSAAPINVTYVYTLAANGCTNPSTYSVTFAVNPTATLSSTLSPANICDNATFHYTPTSATTGTSFSWTRATVANITPAGPTAGSNDPAEALHNSSAAPINVSYVYTLAANGCTNPSTYNVTFAVNPTATLSSTLSPANICDNATFHYTPTSATTGTTFSWTRATVANITPAGPTAGSNDPAEALHNSTAAPINVTYVYTLAANGCTNPSTYNVTFAVNPTATLSSTLSPANICDNATFHYTPTSATTGTTFSWTRATVANITPAGPTAGNDDPAEALHNSTAAPINVTYVYTLAANGCTNPTTYNVTFAVNPTATLSSTLSPANICDNATFHYTPTSATTGTTFSWTRASVTNITPAGPTAGSNDPAEALHNSSAAPINVTYVYTLAANGCTNPSTYNVTFAVNPTATLSSTLTPAAICDNATFHYTPTSATTGTSFSWTRATVANITPAGPTAGSNDPAEALHNSTAAPINVTYVYTLAANGCTNPTTYNVTFAVNPTATLSSTLSPANICDNATFHYTPTSPTTGTTFAWSRATVVGISNAASSGSADPSESLSNTTPLQVAVTYVYTLTANGCTNPSTYNVVVTVNPNPVLTSNPTPAPQCSNLTFNYNPTSSTPTTSFAWDRAVVANISNSHATGSSNPAEFLINTTNNTPATVTYVYTLSAYGCTNPTTFNVSVVINPRPDQPAAFNNTPVWDSACQGQTGVVYSVPTDPNTTSYAWSYSGTGISNIGGSTNTVSANFNTSASTGTLAVYAINTYGCYSLLQRAKTVHVIPYNYWLGTIDHDWYNTGNWILPVVPTATISAWIPPQFNDPKITSGNAFCNNFLEQGGVFMDISGGASLHVKGNMSVNGFITGNGIFRVDGSQAQNFIGSTDNIYNFELNNSNGLTIDPSYGTLLRVSNNYIPTAGVLNTNNNFALFSDANSTGSINQGSNAGGYINGEVQVQRYIHTGGTYGVSINSGRAFRFIGHPFTTSIPLTQFMDSIDITGQGGPNNGFTWTSTNSPSSFWYDPTTANGSTSNDPGWTPFTNVNGLGVNAWKPYEGLLLFIRGSKGEGLWQTVYNVSPVTLVMHGPVNQGSHTVSLLHNSNASYNFISNPYPSNIDMSLTTRGSSIGANFWVWDPNQGTAGAYVSQPFNVSYILPSSSAFITTTSSSSNNTIIFDESNKVTSAPSGSLFKTTSGFGANTVQLRILSNNDSLSWDRILLFFNGNSLSSQDAADAVKLSNGNFNFYSIASDSAHLSIDSRPYNDGDVIPLGINTTEFRNYVIRVDDYNVPAGTTLYLRDNYLGHTQHLSQGMHYTFGITSDPASFGNHRFEIVTSGTPTQINNNPIVKNLNVSIMPNPATDGFVNVSFETTDAAQTQITLSNLMGTELISVHAGVVKSGNTKMDISKLAAGIYLINVKCGGQIKTQKLVIE